MVNLEFQVAGTNTMVRTRSLKIVAIVVAATVLAGCSSRQSGVREMLGLDKSPPDEFLVVTKAPLIVPPGSDLVPPDPGAPPTAANNPATVAETATFGARRTTGASSKAESAILASAGVQGADPRIRRRLRAETLRAKEAESTVANQILNIQRDQVETLDPEEERVRLRKKRTGRRISAEDILSDTCPPGSPKNCRTTAN
ncbi:hypothetical protein MNBD_ALPHA09-1797 [hydrothermal vent metagenome]|uniref:DUF3035 domain-containing protein n=1 Tax=hydrothermal vent metagenome TaxID=652676 RepID=A0A3B0TDF9_9ZZZZ